MTKGAVGIKTPAAQNFLRRKETKSGESVNIIAGGFTKMEKDINKKVILILLLAFIWIVKNIMLFLMFMILHPHGFNF